MSYRSALFVGTPQGLAIAIAIVCDDLVGGIKNVWSAAIVLLQLDDLRPWKHLVEAQDIAGVGTAPTIDRLIVVTHNAEIVVLLNERSNHHQLRSVCVLVLVNQ